MSQRIAIIDFETTGMSPQQGARAAEVGIVLIEGGHIVERYHSLMNTGQRMPWNITQLTGITTAMLEDAPPAEVVMREAAALVQGVPMVAHNAAFDSKFWVSELQRLDMAAPHPFACTVLLSRRLYPEAPSHSLGRIVRHLQLPPADKAHRALADAEMTAHLLLRMQADLHQRWHIPDAHHALLQQLQACQKKHLGALLLQLSAQQVQPELPGL